MKSQNGLQEKRKKRPMTNQDLNHIRFEGIIAMLNSNYQLRKMLKAYLYFYN